MKNLVSFQEAMKLYPECERMSEGEFISTDSCLRLKAEEIFKQSYISHLYYVTALVYRVLAQAYMDGKY
jgi:hypothetical protein